MNRFLQQALAGLALSSMAAVAAAQAPAGCVRVSGEETPVAPDAYEADGTPIFCAKPQGDDPAVAQGYAPQASGGWNGRLNTPLPGSQKQGGYGGGAGGVGQGGSFQGRSGQGSGITQGLGQSNRYGNSGAQGYGQPSYGGSGASGYGGTPTPYGGSSGGYGSSPYGSGSAQDPYDPYGGLQPTAPVTPPSPYGESPYGSTAGGQ